MNKKIFITICMFMSVSVFVFAQETDQNEQMKIWMEYMTPGSFHQQMAKMAGEWTTESKMWMQPGADAVVAQGVSKLELLLGGRYLKTAHTGSYMGMPFEGFSLEAYDNATNELYNIWVDNFGTGMMILKGKYDAVTKTIDYKGTMVDPVQKKEVPVREVTKYIDDNNFVFEMYANGPDEKEFKTMEITFKRK